MTTKLNQLLQDESEDAIFARIQEESLRYYNEVELPRRAAEEQQKKLGTTSTEKSKHSDSEPDCSTNTNIRYYNDGTPPCRTSNKLQKIVKTNQVEAQPHCSKNTDSSPLTPVKELFYKGDSQGAEGFHLAAGETYLYPTNYPVRKYQKSIIHSALFHNTLVSLPTGLGKTFIAAVVMYNYYRWFPQGKIVFMAPTRPLVAQQIRACHDIMAIPIKDTVEMTGTMNPVDRLQHWKSKRVFFLTPQVMANDLRSDVCPAKLFKCVVIDEAHRATKEYSYCQVIKELEKADAVFRVLALSATPGSNIKAVVEVIQNLRISTMELRGEDSPDVMPYTHAKQIEPVSLKLSKDITEFREKFLMIFERYAKSLRDSRCITCNVQNITKFQLLKASEKIRSRPPNGISKTRLGVLMSDFSVCMALAHGLDLMQTYGLRAFYHYFTGCEEEENRRAAYTRLNQDVEFHQLMDNLQNFVAAPMDQRWSHPKHEHLVKTLKEHFCQAEEQKQDTKVIIFCQYRVVVSEVYDLLLKIHPLIKPVMFIGQSAGKDKGGLPQKKQIQVMRQFREGYSNVMIATCVAEEGLDIGSVDLLVLMEGQRSPVRLVQRLGRTGRHRQGRCVVLLTQGKEVQKFNEAMATRKSFLSNIQNSKFITDNLYKDEPTMVPSYLMPKLQLVHINVPERITPGKVKKQSDIRKALISKLNDNEGPTETTPYLSSEQMTIIKQELGTLQVNFDKLSFTQSTFLNQRSKEPAMDSEELFKPVFCQRSEYNDWNRVEQQSYLLSHSSDTETLCHLLQQAEAMQLGQHTDINSQLNFSNIVTKQKKANNNLKVKPIIENIVKKKKTEKEEKHGMDIRDCMAAVAEKARHTQSKELDENNVVIIHEPSLTETPAFPLTLSDIQDEKIVNNVDKDMPMLDCAICNSPFREFRNKINNFREPLNCKLLPFTLKDLSSVEIYVQNLTVEVIKNISVSKVFLGDYTESIKETRKNIENLKLSSAISTSGNISGDIGVDDIFESEFQTPQKSTPQENFVESKCMKKTDEINKENENAISKPKEEFFNLEDIFNDEEDDLLFYQLDDNTKTSTPISTNKPTTRKIIVDTGSRYEEECSIKHLPSQVQNQFDTICQNKDSPSKSVTANISTFSSPVRFKIPQLRLNYQAFVGSQDISNCGSVDKSLSPESPILSGQILPINKLNSKIKQALFTESKLEKVDKVNTLLHEPLEISGVDDNSTAAEKDDANILSVSQLFDDGDSGDEGNQDNLDQSSMYTITQMVDKVSVLAGNKKSSKSNVIQTNDEKSEIKSNVIRFGSSDEDSLFDNIDLDGFSIEKSKEIKTVLPNESTNCLNKSRACSFGDRLFEDSKANTNIDNVKNTERKVQFNESFVNMSNETNKNLSSKTKPLACKNGSMTSEDSFITSKWLSCMKTPLHQLDKKIKPSSPIACVKTSTLELTDSDSNSDVFLNPRQIKKKSTTKKFGNINDKVRKPKMFIETEADVSGICSSDEENTSGLDDLDESFINDLTEHPSTSVVDQSVLDMQAKYLQSVKSPIRKPGGYKIPTMSSSILAKDVFSQAIEEDDESYLNDSFCCDTTEIQVENEPSLLEIAEQILNKKKKSRKGNTRKRKKHFSSDSEIDDPTKTKVLKLMKEKLSSSESSEDHFPGGNKKLKRKRILSSDSSPENQYKVKKLLKKKKQAHLLTSEESDTDSDRTI